MNADQKRYEIAVLDAVTLGEDLDLSPLDGVGRVAVYPNTARGEISARLANAEVCLINKVRLGREELESASRLKLICVAATGYDNVDVAYCESRGIAVCNVAGYSTASVCQLTVATALWLVTKLGAYTAAVSDGSYSAGGSANILSPVWHEISGMTWGIAGYGNIGRSVGAVARALGCRVLAFARSDKGDAEYAGLDRLCRESDIISVHLPLNAATRGIFSAEKIALMKKNCIFVNAARGAVADEEALAEAVLAGRIGGLGCDVYSSEPFRADHPFYRLRGLDNVCLTPHMAWGSAEARKRCLNEIILNVRAFGAGERRNRVDRG